MDAWLRRSSPWVSLLSIPFFVALSLQDLVGALEQRLVVMGQRYNGSAWLVASVSYHVTATNLLHLLGG